jgi:hypothetical protein
MLHSNLNRTQPGAVSTFPQFLEAKNHRALFSSEQEDLTHASQSFLTKMEILVDDLHKKLKVKKNERAYFSQYLSLKQLCRLFLNFYKVSWLGLEQVISQLLPSLHFSQSTFETWSSHQIARRLPYQVIEP